MIYLLIFFPFLFSFVAKIRHQRRNFSANSHRKEYIIWVAAEKLLTVVNGKCWVNNLWHERSSIFCQQSSFSISAISDGINPLRSSQDCWRVSASYGVATLIPRSRPQIERNHLTKCCQPAHSCHEHNSSYLQQSSFFKFPMSGVIYPPQPIE